MNREQIIAKVNEVVAEVNARGWLKDFKIDTIDFFSKSATAGWAYPNQNRVSFNEVLARENSERFGETVVHEVAHIIAAKMYPNVRVGHNKEWRSVFKALGGSGKRCHSYDVSSVKRKSKKYIYTCSCMMHFISAIKHGKMTKGKASYRCVHCKETLVTKGRTVNTTTNLKGEV